MEQLRAHFSSTLYHRLLRNLYSVLELEQSSWKRIEQLVDGRTVMRGGEPDEVDLYEIYETLAALATFVRACQERLCRNMTFVLRDTAGRYSHDERLIRELTIRSFDQNVDALAGKLNAAYQRALSVDEQHTQTHKRPVSAGFPELASLIRLGLRGCSSPDEHVGEAP